MSKAMTPGLLTILFLAGGAAAAVGDDKKTPSVSELIRQLDSDKSAERDQAAKALRRLGPSILPQLEKARRHPSAEVRTRVAKLIRDLELQKALAPKRVTLSSNGRQLVDVLAELEKQTGYKISVEKELGERAVALELKNATFWEVVETIRNEARCRVIETEDSGQPCFMLQGTRANNKFVVIDGSFRVELIRFYENRDVDFSAQNKTTSAAVLRLRVQAEPRFKLLESDPAIVQNVLDERGEALEKPTRKEMRSFDSFGRFGRFDQLSRYEHSGVKSVWVKRASTKPKMLRTLRARLPIRVVVERKTVTVAKSFLEAKGISFRSGPHQISIDEAMLDKRGDYRLSFKATSSLPNVERELVNRFDLEAVDGTLHHAFSSSLSTSANEANVEIRWRQLKDQKAKRPPRLVFKQWVTVDYSIPIELSNVPFP